MANSTERLSDDYRSLRLLGDGAAQLHSQHYFALGETLRLTIDLPGVASVEIQGLVADCSPADSADSWVLTLLLLDVDGIPVCAARSCSLDLQLSS